jgi:hypothetical protein
MIFIPAPIIAALTFPGVIVHEAAHQLVCRLTDTPVLDVKYFQMENPAGYVIHARPDSAWKHFFISVAPFLVNTLLAIAIAFPVGLGAAGKIEPGIIEMLLGWLGISIGMHAFPSTGDASSLWQSIKAPTTGWGLRLLATPVCGLIFLGAMLSVVWFDALYAVAICFGTPHLLVDYAAAHP